LSREEILHAAQRLVDRHGLEQLSYPRLAKSIGASATSIYWYFPSKDELVAALIDNVTREMDLRLPPMADGPWDEEIVEYFLAFRRLVQRTRVYREVFAYRVQVFYLKARMAPAMIRHMENGLALFVRAGLTVDEAILAFNAFSGHVRSFVLVEQAWQDGEPEDDHSQLLKIALAKVPHDLPALNEIDDLSQAEMPDDDLYRRGLDLLVAGLCHKYPKLALTCGAR
jgi:AcrR family transcriptional regulator